MKGLVGQLGALAFLLVVAVARDSHADVRLPIALQAQLARRLGSFDRNFAARVGATAKVLVVRKAGDAESKRIASAFSSSLGALKDIAGVPLVIEELDFIDAASLASRCRSQKVSVLYFSVGLEGDMGSVATAFAGIDVLTIGALPAHAEKGAVVGFDLEEGHPKLVVNLARAKAQNVSFKAELLKLARIVE